MANIKSNKKVSITKFENIMKETYIPIKTIEWNDVEITITPTLSFKEMVSFVDTVVTSCFTTTDNSYVPEVKDFVIKCRTLELYANFALPSHIERKYNLIYCTDAVDTVMQHINMTQFREITNAIDAKINNIVQANIEAINKQMNEVYMAFNNLQEHMSGIFDGIGTDEISKLIGAISEGGIDENKLIQAYLNNKDTEQSAKPDEDAGDA